MILWAIVMIGQMRSRARFLDSCVAAKGKGPILDGDEISPTRLCSESVSTVNHVRVSNFVTPGAAKPLMQDRIKPVSDQSNVSVKVTRALRQVFFFHNLGHRRLIENSPSF